MPGSLITESYRKRRASEGSEGDASAAKRSKTVDSAVSSEVNVSCADGKFCATSVSTADSQSQHGKAAQAADQLPAAEHSPRKENRSPNYEPSQAFLEQQFGLPDDFDSTKPQSSCGFQVPSADHLQLQAQSTDGFLNLLLLADSSLEDTSRSVDQQESTLSYNEEPEGALVSMADESRLSASNNQQSSEPDILANGGHHTVAGLRPSAIASAASLAAIDFDSDSDSSSSEEEEEQPVPSKPRKVEGCGRYGQELNNIAGLALKQTTMLKKKCANRTAKTIRQLKCAPDHSCEAAQRAVEASRLAEEKVQNLARFADAFDDLVKQAVHAANAAAQERADYFASVAAAEMAAAMRGRVASKRGKRRASSPKEPKRLSWASAEQLVQQRVFSKADCPLSSKIQA